MRRAMRRGCGKCLGCSRKPGIPATPNDPALPCRHFGRNNSSRAVCPARLDTRSPAAIRPQRRRSPGRVPLPVPTVFLSDPRVRQ